MENASAGAIRARVRIIGMINTNLKRAVDLLDFSEYSIFRFTGYCFISITPLDK